MSANNIGPSGATALANALEVNDTLLKIDLEGTSVFDNNTGWFNGARTDLGDRAGAILPLKLGVTLTLTQR